MRKTYGTFSDMVRLTLQRARARATCIGGSAAFAAAAPTNVTQSIMGEDTLQVPRPATPRSCRGSDADETPASQCHPALAALEATRVELVEVRIYPTEGAAAQTLPEDVSGFAGVIFSGSAHMVTEKAPWMEAACEWIRRHTLGPNPLPMLGICFGHQLIGVALGGACDTLPQHQVATTPVTWNAAAAEDAAKDPVFGPLFAHSTAAGAADKSTFTTGAATFPVGAFIAQSAHSQVLKALPEGAVSWAATPADGNAIVKFGPVTYGVQFHPEYTRLSMQEMLLAHAVGPNADMIRQHIMGMCALLKDAFDAPAIVACFVATAATKTRA
jgi:GMP synthase (glutamine-hydrolysing)